MRNRDVDHRAPRQAGQQPQRRLTNGTMRGHPRRHVEAMTPLEYTFIVGWAQVDANGHRRDDVEHSREVRRLEPIRITARRATASARR